MSEFHFESAVQVKFIPAEFDHNNRQMASDFYLKTWITGSISRGALNQRPGKLPLHVLQVVILWPGILVLAEARGEWENLEDLWLWKNGPGWLELSL